MLLASLAGAWSQGAAAQAPANCPQWIVSMFVAFQPVQGRIPPKTPTAAQCDASRYANGKWQTSDVSVFIGDFVARAKQNPTQYSTVLTQLGVAMPPAGYATPTAPGTAPQQSGAAAPTGSGVRGR